MYDFDKALNEKRFSIEGIKEIKEYLDFYNKEYSVENINDRFVEYGFNLFNDYCKFIKYYGKKFKDTRKKTNISEWIDLDWYALNDVIKQVSKRKDFTVVEMSNNNILLIRKDVE